ncbi:MAG: hypothetical protein IJ418_09820 [Clostridia bacterium]|nr:hypothetical protein [Clostridia bacterium]
MYMSLTYRSPEGAIRRCTFAFSDVRIRGCEIMLSVRISGTSRQNDTIVCKSSQAAERLYQKISSAAMSGIASVTIDARGYQ